jgi:hypothetical protein
MIRRAAAVVLVLTLHPALLYAQDTVLTINVSSADVHKGPSTVTPVVGHAPRGTVLPVSRNLGSWLKVAWPEGPDGIGYVHMTMGRLGASNGDTRAANMAPGAFSAPAAAPSSADTLEPTMPSARRSASPRIAVHGQQDATPISHIFGVGGVVGSMSSFGASARAWRNDRLGIQLGFTRDAMTSDVATGRVTSMQFEPGVVYSFFDHVSDYVWVRPYVGSGLSFRRQTLTMSTPSATKPSETGVGFRAFGGAELTFATVMRFGLSTEVGYRRFPTPFAGFEADRMSMSIAGHWYIK